MIKRFVLNTGKTLVSWLLPDVKRYLIETDYRIQAHDYAIQIIGSQLLVNQYADLAPEKRLHAPINHHEMKAYSQNGEDGILLYIFSRIGTTNRQFIEFGIGDGSECNAANLVINFGWQGLMLDNSAGNVQKARAFYQERAGQVKIVEASVTKENINRLFKQQAVQGELDLLSIDIDGNDYWVWQAIDVVQPRVVVMEYNATFGAERAISTTYDPTFNYLEKHPGFGFYHGASLAALTKLAQEKGYMLVGCDSQGVNAFFIREDAAADKFEAVPVAQAYYPQIRRKVITGMNTAEQFKQIQHMDFAEV